MFIKTKSNKQPKWYQIRWTLSNLLVKIARKVYPQNPEVSAFWMDIIMDEMISGEAIVRVDPTKSHSKAV